MRRIETLVIGLAGVAVALTIVARPAQSTASAWPLQELERGIELMALEYVERGRLSTIVIVADDLCRNCVNQREFYRDLVRLWPEDPGRVRVLAMTEGDLGRMAEALDRLNVQVDAVLSFPRTRAFRLPAVPTLILVNSDGEVVSWWTGVLGMREQRQVKEMLRALNG